METSNKILIDVHLECRRGARVTDNSCNLNKFVNEPQQKEKWNKVKGLRIPLGTVFH